MLILRDLHCAKIMQQNGPFLVRLDQRDSLSMGQGGMAKKENRQLGCRAPEFFLVKILGRKDSLVKGQIAPTSGDAELFPPEFL